MSQGTYFAPQCATRGANPVDSCFAAVLGVSQEARLVFGPSGLDLPKLEYVTENCDALATIISCF